MKKSFTIKALLILLVLTLVTGCGKVEVGLKISNSDVDFTYTIGVQKAMMAFLTGEGDPFQDSEKELKEDGFTVEKYSDDTYQGIKATKKLGSLADLSTEDEIKDLTLSNDKLENIKLFKIEKKGFFKTTYKASFKTTAMSDLNKEVNSGSSNIFDYDLVEDNNEKVSPDAPDDLEEIEAVTTTEDTVEITDTQTTDYGFNVDDLKKQVDKMEVNFVVELPSSPGKNNATKVDGKKLVWDLKTFKEETLEFEFSTLNMTNVILVGGGVLLLLIIIVSVILMSKRKGKVEPAEFADKPIPEVIKKEVVDPVVPTDDIPSLTPVGEPKVKVEAPAVEATHDEEELIIEEPQEAKTE